MRVEKSSAGAVSGSDDVAASTTFESSSSFHSISSQPPTLLTLNHPLLPHPPTPFYPSQCPSSLVSSSSSVCLGCGRHTRLTSPQLSRPLAGPPSPSLSSTTPQGKGAVGGADPKGASEESQRPGSFLLSLLLSLSGYLIHCVILTSNPPPPSTSPSLFTEYFGGKDGDYNDKQGKVGSAGGAHPAEKAADAAEILNRKADEDKACVSLFTSLSLSVTLVWLADNLLAFPSNLDSSRTNA